LYAEGAELTGVGFWRIAVAVAGFVALVMLSPSRFRIDPRGLAIIGLVGGGFVATFEIAYQFAIAGAGVAGAAALLYTAPVIVTLLAVPLLSERLTPGRLATAAAVMIGATLTVQGGQHGAGGASGLPGLGSGVVGGLMAAAAYAGTTLLARWAVPRYGILRVLFYELLGGALLLGVGLTAVGRAPSLPPGPDAWVYVGGLSIGTVILANLFFFEGVRRIDAAPTAVAATIEPVVGAMLALMLFGQRLSIVGWVGLVLVVTSVASGYWREARSVGGQ